MKTRYRLTRRGIRGNKFYCVDTTTGKRTSLRTANEDEARQIVEARNNSERQPVLNLQIAKAYLAGTDNGIATRTWQQAIESLASTKQAANQHRWKTAAKDKAFVPLMPRIIIETSGELLLKVLQTGTVSTNVFLRRLHNFCVDMNWLPWPLIPKRQWTAVPVIVHLGAEALNLFKDLPSEGVLFPYLSRVRANDRATEFRSRCRQLGINGVTLHSYRYAWAERAKTVGYPERFAQEALGHNSKAVHRAYAKRALMKIPSLEDYEQRAAVKVGPAP